MYIPRRLTRTLRDALAGFPAIVLTGPRQSGKTTLLRQEAGERVAYVSFDDPLERDFATVDPVGFLARFGEAPVILDEIQHVPGLLPHLKMRIDADPTPGRFCTFTHPGPRHWPVCRGSSPKAFPRFTTWWPLPEATICAAPPTRGLAARNCLS